MIAGDEIYRFRHILIRDAAYDGLPKATRAIFHQTFVVWLDLCSREITELDELAGYHLEHAARYKSELGDVDPELARVAALHSALLSRAPPYSETGWRVSASRNARSLSPRTKRNCFPSKPCCHGGFGTKVAGRGGGLRRSRSGARPVA